MEFKMTKGEFPKEYRCCNMRVFQSPFGNCQVFSIAYATTMLNLTDDELNEFIRKCIYNLAKTIAVIDIAQRHYPKMKEKLSKAGVFITGEIEYTSSNGSDMIVLVLKLETESNED